MHNLFIINDTMNGYLEGSLLLLSFLSITCGIAVIISKNPVVSVLYLIGLFLSISCYLILIGLNFIGLSYLLVYVGAVSILFLFILMLINVRISELLSDTSNSLPLAVLVAIAFNFTVYEVLPDSMVMSNTSLTRDNYFSSSLYDDYVKSKSLDFANNGEIAFVTSKIWDGGLAENTHITSLGNIMYTSYSVWLVLTSIILLLAMVGAIVITIKQKHH